jgi:sugar diacid utilization regulator
MEERLLELMARMFEECDEDEILRLAAESITAVSPCRIEADYLVRDDVLRPNARRAGPNIGSQVHALRGADGMITGTERAWCRAFGLRNAGHHRGYLVVSAAVPPADHEVYLLTLMARQIALALTNATMRRWDRGWSGRPHEQSGAAHDPLATAMSDLERERSLYRSLSGVSTSGTGEQGLVEALHTVTGLPALIEDRFGNLRAWAGPGRPDEYPKPGSQRRREFLREVTRRGPVARVKDRLVALAHTRDDMLGVLAIVDADGTAGQLELLALEHGVAKLVGELRHQHDMVELDRRLRGDLVADLLTGTAGESAYARSRAIDHDLHDPHHVVAIRWDEADDDVLCRAAEHAAASLGVRSLVSTWRGVTVLLAGGLLDARMLRDAVARRLRTSAGSIGVGGRCDSPEEFPRSYQEAVLALDIRSTSRSPHGATAFDELGVIRVLDTGDGCAKIRQFVLDWLGPLLDYDSRNRSHLVLTLAQHLDCGGNYDATAAELVIHRSTLRYRLRRIREISGLDLTDADNRLNLHVATRAWRTLDGPP